MKNLRYTSFEIRSCVTSFTRSSTVFGHMLLVFWIVLCILAPISASKGAVRPTWNLRSENVPRKSIKLDSIGISSGFQLELELDSLGAGIRTGILNDPDKLYSDEGEPLVIFSPIQQDSRDEKLMMANIVMLNDLGLQLRLDQLSWKSFDIESSDDSSSTTRFEAVIKDFDTNEPVLRLVKAYKISQQNNVIDCNITLHNLTSTEQKVSLRFFGPGGLNKLSTRSDMRTLVACFRDATEDTLKDISLTKRDLIKTKGTNKMQLPGQQLLWIAATNQRYATILVPLPDEGKSYCNWINDITGYFYGPDDYREAKNYDGAIGIQLRVTPCMLKRSGEAYDSKTYSFKLYIGPKNKSLFQGNELFRKLGFMRLLRPTSSILRLENIIIVGVLCVVVISLITNKINKKHSV